MKALVLLVFLSTAGKPDAERRPGFWWKQAGIAALNLVSGFAFYQTQVVKHNPYAYSQRHPNADPQWWNPVLSARNKYRNGNPAEGPKFFGSTTFLAWTTDKYHLNNTLRNAFTAGATGISMTLWARPRWQQIVTQIIINWATFALGTGVGYQFYKQ